MRLTVDVGQREIGRGLADCGSGLDGDEQGRGTRGAGEEGLEAVHKRVRPDNPFLSVRQRAAVKNRPVRLASPADADGVPKRAYWFRGDVAAALVKAGYEPVPAALKDPDS